MRWRGEIRLNKSHIWLFLLLRTGKIFHVSSPVALQLWLYNTCFLVHMWQFQPVLTTVLTLRVAESISNEFRLLWMAANLTFSEDVTGDIIATTPDVRLATHRVLTLWRSGVSTPQEAYRKLKKALKNTNQNGTLEPLAWLVQAAREYWSHNGE